MTDKAIEDSIDMSEIDKVLGIDPVDEEWLEQIQRAKEILNAPDKVIYINKMGTRLGATYSTIQTALKMGKKVCVFEPYHTIIEQTVIPASEGFKVGHLKSIDKMCIHHKKIGNIALKGNCNKCPDADICRLQTFFKTDYDLIAMTYSKVLLLDKSDNDDTGLIFNKILNSDIIFMDEYSHAIHNEPYQTNIKQLKGILSKIIAKEIPERSEGKRFDTIDLIKDFLENIPLHEPTYAWSYSSILKDDFELFLKHYGFLMKFVDNKSELKCIESFLYSMEYDRFYIMDGLIIPDVTHPVKIFNNIIKNYKGKVLITDALLPTTKLLKGTNMIWNDFKDTQSKQLIICDTRKAPLALYTTDFKKYARDYYEQIDRLRKFIWYIANKFGSKNVVIFTINKGISDKIKGLKFEDLDKEFNSDDLTVLEYDRLSYYRSDISAGVDMPQRIMICVNLPFTPMESMAGYAKVFANLPEYQYLFNSEIINYSKPMKEEYIHNDVRKDEMLNTFFNTIGRVKDKNAVDNSVVFVFGSTKDEVIECLPQSDWNIISTTSGNFGEQAYLTAKIWLNKDIKATYKDLPGLESIGKVVNYIYNKPQAQYNINQLRRKLHIDNLSNILKEYNNLLPWCHIKDGNLNIYDADLKSIINNNHFNKKIKGTINALVKKSDSVDKKSIGVKVAQKV